MFYLTTHSTHFIYGYMVSDIWLRTILIVRKETRCRQIGYSLSINSKGSFICTIPQTGYTSRGALAGTRNSSMGPPHEGSIRWPIAPWANALPLSYVPLPNFKETGKGNWFNKSWNYDHLHISSCNFKQCVVVLFNLSLEFKLLIKKINIPRHNISQ